MKKLSLLLVVIFAGSVLFTGCKPAHTPERVVEKYLNHLSNHEYDEAAKYCTDETAQILSFMAWLVEEEEPTGEKYENIECSVEEDKAYCTYNIEGFDDRETISLIKIDDEWKVHMEK